MGTYKRPKVNLHHEFLYLNYDTVLNALSALEAGAVDEIILKSAEAREGGLDASIGYGPVKGGAAKKKQSNIQEELVRTRTWFSAFDAWHTHLAANEGIGTFDSWDFEVRSQISVGDTLEFRADLTLSPVHKVLATYMSFASAGTSGGLHASAKDAQEAKKNARMMESWITGKDGRRNLPVYLRPGGAGAPRIAARLDDNYIIGGMDNLEGEFTVVAQVDALLRQGQEESIIRVIRDVPPTPKEVEVVTNAMREFIEPSKELGVEISEDDLNFTYPTVILRPIAIFK